MQAVVHLRRALPRFAPPNPVRLRAFPATPGACPGHLRRQPALRRHRRRPPRTLRPPRRRRFRAHRHRPRDGAGEGLWLRHRQIGRRGEGGHPHPRRPAHGRPRTAHQRGPGQTAGRIRPLQGIGRPVLKRCKRDLGAIAPRVENGCTGRRGAVRDARPQGVVEVRDRCGVAVSAPARRPQARPGRVRCGLVLMDGPLPVRACRPPHRSAELSVDASSLAVSCGSRGVSLDIEPPALSAPETPHAAPAWGRRQGSLPVREASRRDPGSAKRQT